VVKRITYDSFGNILEDTNASFTIPFGFAGGLQDRDTGLVRFGYRDYDPEVGRWTAKDPIGFNGGDTDLYGYVVNNPVGVVDPEGLWTISVGVFINGALGIGGGGGMELNFGYSNSAGFSFSLAGTTQGGAIAGASAFVGAGILVTNACSVNQLNGMSYQFGRAGFGMGPSFAVEGVKGSDYYGGTFYGGIGPGYTANSFTASTTSAIIQYDNGALSIGNNGTSSIWSKKLY
jgi:RHS repeat-associated protein